MPSAPPMDFRHLPGSFPCRPHAAFAFIGGIGVHWRSLAFLLASSRALWRRGESRRPIQNPAMRAMRRS